MKTQDMNEKINRLNEKIKKLRERCSFVEGALNSLRALDNADKDDKTFDFKELQKFLKIRSNVLSMEIWAIEDEIQAQQEQCTHKHPDGRSAYTYSCTGHNSTYYVCTICGHEDER